MHLWVLPITTIKLDRSFIQRLPHDICDRAIVESNIVVSRQFDLDTVAEGLETPKQLAFLLDQGYTIHQGFLYSPAIKANVLSAFLN